MPFDPREVIARIVDGSRFSRVQAALRHQHRHRLGLHPRLPGRHPRQHSRRAVHRRVQEGNGIHPAGQPDRHAAGLPAERHRLHGRHRVRAGRHRQGRRQDDQRRHQQHRPAHHDQHGRLVRRRQLRDVRARLRPPLHVQLAERQTGRDGRGAAGRGDVHRREGLRCGRRSRRSTTTPTRSARPRSRRRSNGNRTRSSSRPASTTTGSSTPATPARYSGWPCRPPTPTLSRGAAASASSGCEDRDNQAAHRQPR